MMPRHEHRFLLPVLLVTIMFSTIAVAAETGAPGSMTVDFDGRLLTVRATAVPVGTLFKEIERKTNVRIEVGEGVEGAISLNCSNREIAEVIDLILETLGEKNYAAEYVKREGVITPTRVLIVRKGSTKVLSPEVEAAIRRDVAALGEKKTSMDALVKLSKGGPEAIPFLAEELRRRAPALTTAEGEGQVGIVMDLCSILKDIGDPSALPVLREMLAIFQGRYAATPAISAAISYMEIAEISLSAAEKLRRLDTTAMNPEERILTFVGLLGDTNNAVSLTAQNELVKSGNRSVSALAAVLKTGDVQTRRAAVSALHQIGAAVGYDAVLEVMLGALGDTDVWVRGDIIQRLGESKDRRAAAALLNGLRNDSALCLAYSRALQTLQEEKAIPILVGYLRDTKFEANAKLLFAAVDGLNTFGSQAVPALKQEFANSNDPVVRRLIARLFGSIGDPSAIPLLKESLADPALKEVVTESLRQLEQGKPTP